ncbi:MAG: endo-1,4-beta-xylanase [Lentisphaeria bacterium]|jgi:GH35 family endo-1,4-beta-xylanase|nr:endo-1,4-beta-xylanase [Lentisphaeria bacterium]
MNELARDIARNLLKDDPEIESRIARGIEEHRKGSGTIRVVGPDGKPLPGAQVKLRHVRHEFHFGCNAFMLEQFREPEKNARYEEAFAAAFNLAVVPFYWSDTEPERGKPRFDKNSPYVYRRPPTDMVLEFCDRHGITPKGHPLCWHSFVPDWAPLDKPGLARETERRITEIAERYGRRIGIWDVCNEAVEHNPLDINNRVPERHVEFAFEVASRTMPRSAVLTYNDYSCWQNHGEYTAMYMLCRHLKSLSHLNFGAIGLQYHQFTPNAEHMRGEANGRLNPRHLFAMLDLYGKLGLPVNISEITITGRAELGDGPAFQKEVAERLYRLWFSHPALNGIVYWNLVDDTAYVRAGSTWNENIYKGGLLHHDLSPKPAFEALRRLIREEWSTQVTLAYNPQGENRFRGFYGDYEAEVKTDRGVSRHTLKLARNDYNTLTLQIG